MGQVYEAEHVHLPRRVALKVLRADRHDNEHLARFRQEARAASRIGHPAIVDVVDFAQLADGGVYLAMELLQGESFEDWLARPGRLADALPWLAEIARGLDAAHHAGVVHRDVKPQNLFLHAGATGIEPKILDFGIAKLTGASFVVEDLRTGTAAKTEHTRIETRAGTVLGTPYYLAPERVLGRPLQPSADLYGLGVILYEVLTGTVPFSHDTFMGVLAAHVQVQPLDPRQAAPDRAIPDGIALLTMELLAKDPAARPASGAAVAERIEALLMAEGPAIAAVQTGPREQSTPEQQTVHLDAQAERPTTPPDDSLAAARLPRGGTQPVGPMLAFSGGRAIRTRFDTVSPSGAEERRARGAWVWFVSGVAVVAVAAAIAWGVLASRVGQDAESRVGTSVSAPTPTEGTPDASGAGEASPPANPPAEGDTNGTAPHEVEEPPKATKPREATPEEPAAEAAPDSAGHPPRTEPQSKPEKKPEKKRASTSRPSPEPAKSSARGETKSAVPAFKDDVYKD